MEIATWILVVILSFTLFVFLIAGVILLIRLIQLTDDAKKIIATGQSIATKTDDIVDNVKGVTSVGGIVKTFANHVVETQERRYAEQDAERAAKEAREAELKQEKAREEQARKAKAVKKNEEEKEVEDFVKSIVKAAEKAGAKVTTKTQKKK